MGNDIVSLAKQNQPPKSSDTRFLDRVFTPAEQTLITGASNPELVLWIVWAAKETAFKIISKMKNVPNFSYKQYEVLELALGKLRTESGELELNIQTEHGEVPVRVHWEAGFIHAVGKRGSTETEAQTFECAWGASDFSHPTQETLRDFEASQTLLSAEEKKSAQSLESAWVRYFTKQDIAQKTGMQFKDLQIIRPRMQAPYLLNQGKRVAMDLSLSHHGPFVAWVFSF